MGRLADSHGYSPPPPRRTLSSPAASWLRSLASSLVGGTTGKRCGLVLPLMMRSCPLGTLRIDLGLGLGSGLIRARLGLELGLELGRVVRARAKVRARVP